MEELEAAKEELEIKIANEKIAKPKLTEEQILFYLHKFRVLNMSNVSVQGLIRPIPCNSTTRGCCLTIGSNENRNRTFAEETPDA